jgi:hypothetical protein
VAIGVSAALRDFPYPTGILQSFLLVSFTGLTPLLTVPPLGFSSFHCLKMKVVLICHLNLASASQVIIPG